LKSLIKWILTLLSLAGRQGPPKLPKSKEFKIKNSFLYARKYFFKNNHLNEKDMNIEYLRKTGLPQKKWTV